MDLVGNAEYKLHKNQQLKLRKWQPMPTEADVSKVTDYTVPRIATIVNDNFCFGFSAVC